MNVRLHIFRRFVRAGNGNVAILFGLLGLPLLGFTGAAIDYGFAVRRQVKLQAATDAAALSLCQMPLAATRSELQRQAAEAMTGFMGSAVSVDTLGITSNPRQITLTTHTSSAVLFGRFTGRTSEIEMGTTARCATPLPKTFEIALVLDNTGSMASSGGGQSKMDALKSAATKFVDYVFDNDAFAADTRISIVPFAGSVKIPESYRSTATWIDRTNKSSLHWNNVNSPSSAKLGSRMDIFEKLKKININWGWAGCLEALPYPLNVEDGRPVSTNNDSYFVPMFAPDEPGNGSAGTPILRINNVYYMSANSYLNDETDERDSKGNKVCDVLADNTSFPQRLGRACKYVLPKGAVISQPDPSTLRLPNGPNYGCTSQPLQPLIRDRDALKAQINNLISLGSTNTHEGVMWGWRTLSPKSVFSSDTQPPAAYENSAVNKIMIVMSDGENQWPLNTNQPYNYSQYTPYAYLKNADGSSVDLRVPPDNRNMRTLDDPRKALDALTTLGCENTKKVGISIYTIGFSVPNDPIDDQGLKLLKDCASTPAQSSVASSADDLIKAFDDIAKSIGKLRLTQ